MERKLAIPRSASKRHTPSDMLLVALGACAAIVAPATTTSPSPELGRSLDVVVEIFVGANCTGKQRRVKMDDLVGGNNDNGWDACGGAWDDGTAMRWPWWGSYRVAAGHAIMTGSRCYDSSNDGYPVYQEVGMTSEAGCVSPDYTFTYVSLPTPPSPPSPPPPSPPPLSPPPPPSAAAATAAAATAATAQLWSLPPPPPPHHRPSPPPPPLSSPPQLMSTPALVSALLILIAVALIFLRQVRFARDRAKFDLQILGLEMRNLERAADSATPSWRRRNSRRAPCAAVAPARGESQIELPCTPQSCTGLMPPPPAGVLTKLEVPTKVPEISTDAALEINTDAALEISTDTPLGCLADGLANVDSEHAVHNHRTRRHRRMRRTRATQSAVM